MANFLDITTDVIGPEIRADRCGQNHVPESMNNGVEVLAGTAGSVRNGMTPRFQISTSRLILRGADDSPLAGRRQAARRCAGGGRPGGRSGELAAGAPRSWRHRVGPGVAGIDSARGAVAVLLHGTHRASYPDRHLRHQAGTGRGRLRRDRVFSAGRVSPSGPGDGGGDGAHRRCLRCRRVGDCSRNLSVVVAFHTRHGEVRHGLDQGRQRAGTLRQQVKVQNAGPRATSGRASDGPARGAPQVRPPGKVPWPWQKAPSARCVERGVGSRQDNRIIPMGWPET